MNILGSYEITYANGFKQIKNLISHDSYINIIKPTEWQIYELEKKNRWKPTPESKQLKKDLIAMFSATYFTDKSPLYEAYLTGYIDIGIAYKINLQPCKVVKIKQSNLTVIKNPSSVLLEFLNTLKEIQENHKIV
jgi:hypothetical protein